VDLESGDVTVEDICAIEWAAYKQALHTVIDLDPGQLALIDNRYRLGLLV
jgi:hypothetical protein